METVRYSRLGLEDLRVGRSTFEVTLADGSVVVLNEIPLGRFIADNGGTITQAATSFAASNVSYLAFNNSAATTVTNITGGVDGQFLFLKMDGQTTLSDSAGGTGQLTMAEQRSITPLANVFLLFFYDGAASAWRQVAVDPTRLVGPVRIKDSSGNLVHAFGATS